MRVHKYAKLIPDMSPLDYARLENDIASNGLREPIVTYEGQILDGRHRNKACKATGVEPRFSEYEGDDPISFVWSANGARRHLSSSQLAAIGAEIAEVRKNGHGGNRTKLSKDNLKANESAAAEVGSSPAQVARAQRVKRESPEVFEEVKQGKLTVTKAEKQVRDQKKKDALQKKADEAQSQFDEPQWELWNKDCIDGLQSIIDHHGPARLIFTDPPYNIGVDYYGEGAKADKRSDAQYMLWVLEWLELSREVLADDGSLFVMICDEYAAEYRVALRDLGFHLRSWLIRYESFGVNVSAGFNRTHRHIFYVTKHPKAFVFHQSAVNRPSARQSVYGDKRAESDGKNWDDVITHVPRLPGTCKERLPDFPTQLPIDLVQPLVECASDPGDLVVDPFNGSGTTGVACIRSHRKYIGIEKNETACDMATRRLTGEV